MFHPAPLARTRRQSALAPTPKVTKDSPCAHIELIPVDERTVILPWGSHEEHGPLLPADTDTKLANHVSSAVAEFVERCTVLPAIPYGISTEHLGFPSTVSLTSATAFSYLQEVLESTARTDPDLIVIINGHGGNDYIARAVAAEFNYKHDKTKVLICHVVSEDARKLSLDRLGHFDAHAGSAETSLMSAIDDRISEDLIGGTYAAETVTERGMLRLFPSHELAADGIITTNREIVVDPSLGRAMLSVAINDISGSITRTRAAVQRHGMRRRPT